MEILERLFGSDTRIKTMRMFLFNSESVFTMDEVVERTKSNIKEIRKEMANLINAGLIKKRTVTREISKKKGKKIITKKVNDIGYLLEQKFPYLQALKNLLIMASLHADDNLVKKFNAAGRIKLFLASGLFIQEWDSRVDLLIVGDDLNMSKLDSVIKNIEAEIGREIAYSAFETNDFEYRLGIHDKLIRDILDFPHTILVDKIGVQNK